MLNDFTVSAWVKLSTISGIDPWTIVARTNSSDRRDYFLFFDTTLNKFVIQRHGLGSWTNTSVFSNNLYSSTTSWYHVVAVGSENTGKLYINGVLDGIGTFASVPITASKNLSIGAANTSLGWIYKFKGKIDDVQIFNYALNATQIKMLFNQNSAVRFGQ